MAPAPELLFFMSVAPVPELQFFITSFPTPASGRFAHINILIVLVYLNLNGK